jgi:hypothetical protein
MATTGTSHGLPHLRLARRERWAVCVQAHAQFISNDDKQRWVDRITVMNVVAASIVSLGLFATSGENPSMALSLAGGVVAALAATTAAAQKWLAPQAEAHLRSAKEFEGVADAFTRWLSTHTEDPESAVAVKALEAIEADLKEARSGEPTIANQRRLERAKTLAVEELGPRPEDPGMPVAGP